MITHSNPTDLLPLVGLGAEQPWPRGASRLELVACFGGREIWGAASAEGDAVSVVTFPAEPTPGELDELGRIVAGLGELEGAPGVVKVVEANLRRGYVCLEPIVGVLHDSPALGLQLSRKLDLMRGLCVAMSALNERSRFHGALCPDVIGLDKELAPRLLDVGGRGPGPSESRLYAAPEVLDGEAPDARSDVYSLGRILAFLLLGSDPPLETALVPRLDCLARTPAGLSRIVRRATCVEPLLRYPSVEALARDLERYGDFENVGLMLPNAAEQNFTGLSSPPVSAPRSATLLPPTRQSPRASRPRLGVALALAGVGLLAAATLVANPVQLASRWLARRELANAAPESRGAAARKLLGLGERAFSGVSFEGADLSGAPLSFAALDSARLNRASLDRADLAGASLQAADLTSVSALGTDWSGALVGDAIGLETVRCDDETLPPEDWECRAGTLARATGEP